MQQEAMAQPWQFWIDVGGTFTDCIALPPNGPLRQFKTLSSGLTKGTIERLDGTLISDRLRHVDPQGFWNQATIRLYSATADLIHTTTVTDFNAAAASLTLKSLPPHLNGQPPATYELDLQLPAPVVAIRWLLGLQPGQQCPPVRVRFGTTRGTNALLTRTGARTALITTSGFADIPLIGNQDRPHLFDLNICKPAPLFSQVFEVKERTAANGQILQPLDPQAATQLSQAGLTPDRFDSVAICLLNAYSNTHHEQQLEALIRGLGFEEVSRSSEVSPLIRIVPRCDTTVLDAYLNPVLRQYLQTIRTELPGSEIQVMTSTGGLVDSDSFRGRDCILSGPAGGIVGFSQVARSEGHTQAIGFDMGGTSTDVARFDGNFEFQNETTKAGVRIMTPVLAIETVAAGGGSVCGFDGTRLFVGPQSAGSSPGPACYGAGGPLTITDLNVFLGRILPQHFPFLLNMAAIESRLTELHHQMVSASAIPPEYSLHSLAEGLLQIANDNMVQAIRKVSVAKGYHPADHVLVSFGGAGGQHACSVARSLGISKVLIHPFAGILSAYGMGQASVRAIRQCSVLLPLSEDSLTHVREIRQQLQQQTHDEVAEQGIGPQHIQPAALTLELRYQGTDSSLSIAEPADGDFRSRFEAEHKRLFGYIRQAKPIEIASMQVETIGQPADNAQYSLTSGQPPAQSDSPDAPVPPSETTTAWFDGTPHSVRIVHRQHLSPAAQIPGPAIICEPTSTIWIDPDSRAEITSTGTVLIHVDTTDPQPTAATSASEHTGSPDPVLLEVINNQFVSIAQQMGETLRRTSTSTNVRERLDFSCALFDSAGRLVVNAPHVPVHLGAMGETVRAIMADHPDMQPQDVFVTNDPYRGGSHLPDVTVVTPVFTDTPPAHSSAHTTQQPAFFVANRAHHAEIGGIVPGSMPPFSTRLAEEGILIRSRKLVNAGQSCESELRQLLTSGPYPTRSVEDNIADLAAQAAANECGVRLLHSLADRYPADTVRDYMKHIQSAAAVRMRQCLSSLEDRRYTFADQLDDGTKIRVAITVTADTATVDFTGTDQVHTGNLNANKAITTSAVLYCFRCLLNEDIPLNAGVLEPVTLIIPPGLLNPPAAKDADPEDLPAIVGGNVETSQRIVDVVLGALGLAAASQGTMNNLTFGDDTFGYYETICGGSGATPSGDGAHAVHTHMTNTRLTDPEVLEHRYPVRLHRFTIRAGSGGAGRYCGGDGIVREIEFLQPLHVSMLSQRRSPNAPYGLDGGQPGSSGINTLQTANSNDTSELASAFSVTVTPGDVLTIQTPGGGGCGTFSP
jgi:5-oxoprolinase (ATP-hydrolysing)